jgi:hypothetical protein
VNYILSTGIKLLAEKTDSKTREEGEEERAYREGWDACVKVSNCKKIDKW